MKEKTISFALAGIRTEQFAIFEEDYVEGIATKLLNQLDFKLQLELNNVLVYATFTFEQNDKPIVKAQVICKFNIKAENWNTLIKGDTLVLPKKLATHFSMITVGTARGIIHSKVSNTGLNTFMLPTIDITKMVTGDVVFKMK